ncbi:hypothetical protein ACOMHN_018365 [Nucella lapillus]
MDIDSWLLSNDKDVPEAGMRTAFPPFLRRPRPAAQTTGPCPDRDWTNPNRFSDPPTRSSRLSNTLGLTLPGRPNKAYTWYLENELPWRLNAARAKAAKDDASACSLFGKSWKPAGDVGLDADSRKKRRNGASLTWERVRQDRARTVLQHYNTLEPRPTTRTPDRLSPHTTLNRRGLCVSPNGTWNRRRSPVNNAYSAHLPSPQSSPSESKRSSHSPNRLGLGSGLTTSRHASPCGSQRSSSNRSPQGTLNPLSPGLARRRSPNLRLSPTQHSVLGASFSGSHSQYGPSSHTLSRASFVSQWVNNSSSSSLQLSPYSARSSQTSSGREDGDVSYGSETDDDFLYISCQQLSQGLAGLSVTSAAEPFRQSRGDHIVENPTFVLPDDDDYFDDDDDFIGCSDDALSDDVFLDSPQPSAGSKRASQSRNASSEPAQNEANIEQGADAESETGADGVDHPAVESLRRNSLQTKLRQTWQHRRHKAANARAVKLKGATVDTPVHPPSDTALSLSPTDGIAQNTGADDGVTVISPETKSCFYYVISPTDDVNMPDVIAVRRSSVELIRWQNSLRRRRRRQAKRHDLGRNKKKEPKQAGTV